MTTGKSFGQKALVATLALFLVLSSGLSAMPALAAAKAPVKKAAKAKAPVVKEDPKAVRKSLSEGNAPVLDLETPPPAPVDTSLTPVSSMTENVDAPAPVKQEPVKPISQVKQPARSAVKPAVYQPGNRIDKVKYKAIDTVTDKLGMQPVSYTPLPAIAIFPVIRHGNEKAFGDLPLIFSREFSQKMELKVPEGTKVFHPIYTVDELRMRGLGHLYDKIMDYYLKAGRPEPMAMDYMLKQLTADGRSISRVIFVEADLDMTRPMDVTAALDLSGIKDRVSAVFTDSTPKNMRYHVRSRVQAFDAENPEFPMVWGWSWDRSVKANRVMNVTPSVFMDSDSQQAFSRVSREMSREMLVVMPRKVYMEPVYDASVQGKLVSQDSVTPAPSVTDASMEAVSAEPLSAENRQAIDRILKHQQVPSP